MTARNLSTLKLTDSELALIIAEFQSAIDSGASDEDFARVLAKAEEAQRRAKVQAITKATGGST